MIEEYKIALFEKMHSFKTALRYFFLIWQRCVSIVQLHMRLDLIFDIHLYEYEYEYEYE